MRTAWWTSGALACDALVEIPMDGNVPSLNVGLASGICLYERSRQATS